VDFCPPPADAYEQEAPVLEKLWRFAFEGVTDELEDPSEDEEAQGVDPEAMDEQGGCRCGDRNDNGWNAQSVAGSVYGMLVAGRVLRDPLFAGAAAWHAEG
jgi:hypothetical protein